MDHRWNGKSHEINVALNVLEKRRPTNPSNIKPYLIASYKNSIFVRGRTKKLVGRNIMASNYNSERLHVE